MAGLTASLAPGLVRLRVADLERSLRFYRDVLGLRVMSEEAGAVALDPGDCRPALLELHEESRALPAGRRRTLGLYHFALLVPDSAELGRVLRRLGRAEVPLGASDHLVSEALYVADPDGIGVEIYRDRPRSEWRYEGGELRMTTLPLDLPALLRGAGDDRDGRIAPETRVGHVHLHVADLATAERFFRDGVGMELTVASYPGARFFGAGGYHHHVGANVWAGADASPAGEDNAGLIDWELSLPSGEDPHPIAANLEALGFAPEPADGGWRVRDPAGTTLRIVAGPDGAVQSPLSPTI